jgi:hypothetical protein
MCVAEFSNLNETLGIPQGRLIMSTMDRPP